MKKGALLLRVPGRLGDYIENIRVSYEVSPRECTDQEEHERDPVEHILRPHGIPINFSK